MEAEPSPSEQSRKGLSKTQVLSEDESDIERLTGAEKGLNSDIYSLEEINVFLDDTFGKSVKVTYYFQDTNKCVRSAAILQKLVGFEALNEKKRYGLKKHITALKKTAAAQRKRNIKKIKHFCHASQGVSVGLLTAAALFSHFFHGWAQDGFFKYERREGSKENSSNLRTVRTKEVGCISPAGNTL